MSPSFILQDLSAMFQNKKTLISVLSALPDYCPFVRVESWLGPRRSKGIRLSLDPPPPATYINLGWRAGPGRSTDTTTTKSSYDQYKNSFNTRVDIMCLECTWLI